MTPTIELLSTDPLGWKRFKLTLEPEDAAWRSDWLKRGKPEPWCEFTVIPDDKEPYLISYGGELWPLAWPQLFCKRSHFKTTLTPAGRQLCGLPLESNSGPGLDSLL